MELAIFFISVYLYVLRGEQFFYHRDTTKGSFDSSSGLKSKS